MERPKKTNRKPIQSSNSNNGQIQLNEQNKGTLVELSRRPVFIITSFIGTLVAITLGISALYKIITSGPKINIIKNQLFFKTLGGTDNKGKQVSTTYILLALTIINSGDKPLYPQRIDAKFKDDFESFIGVDTELDSIDFGGKGYKVKLLPYKEKNLQAVTVIQPQSRVDGYLVFSIDGDCENFFKSRSKSVEISITDVDNKKYIKDLPILNLTNTVSPNGEVYPKSGIIVTPENTFGTSKMNP